MEALVHMVVSTPEDADEKTRFKYVLCVVLVANNLQLCIDNSVIAET